MAVDVQGVVRPCPPKHDVHGRTGQHSLRRVALCRLSQTRRHPFDDHGFQRFWGGALTNLVVEGLVKALGAQVAHCR